MSRKCPNCERRIDNYNIRVGKLCEQCLQKSLDKHGQVQANYYDIPDLQRILGYDNPEQVRRLAREQEIPGRMPIRTLRFEKEKIEEWIRSGAYKPRRPRRLSKEWKKHQDKLRALSTKWVEQIWWPRQETMPEAWGIPTGDEGRCQDGFCWTVSEDDDLEYSGYPEKGNVCKVRIYSEAEHDPLFLSISEHLEGDELLSTYEQFKRMGGQYWYACSRLKGIRLDWEDTLRSGGEGSCDDLDAWKEVERLAGELTKLKRQMSSRLREILDTDEFPGECSRCLD